MRRPLLQLLGCLLAVGLGIAAFFGGLALLLGAVVGAIGWPATILSGLLLALLLGGSAWLVARRLSSALQNARAQAPYAPYRARLKEIDGLLGDVERRVVEAAGDETSVDLRGKLLEIRSRRDRVVEGILEIDRFLGAPGHEETRLAFDGALFRFRARFARDDLRGTFDENSRRLDRIGERVRALKEEREALLAGLESIAIGLKEIRARLATPGAKAGDAAEGIGKELSALSRELDRLETAHAEIEELERDARREGTVVAGSATEVPAERRQPEPPKITR